MVTERESWILGNKDRDPNLSDVANAQSIEPGYSMMTKDQQAALVAEVKGVLEQARARRPGGGSEEEHGANLRRPQFRSCMQATGAGSGRRC